MAVKYAFITTIESCIDVAHHICSVEHLGTPKDNGDAIRRLGKAGIVEPEIASSVAAAVGFRNVLVHDYVDVDDAVVLARLDDHDDLSSFVAQVATWLSAQDQD